MCEINDYKKVVLEMVLSINQAILAFVFKLYPDKMGEDFHALFGGCILLPLAWNCACLETGKCCFLIT